MAPRYTPRVHEFVRSVLVPALTDDVFGGSDNPIHMLADTLPAAARVLDRCESPIEQLVAAAFMARGWFDAWMVPIAEGDAPIIGARLHLRLGDVGHECLMLSQQVTLTEPISARLDFTVAPTPSTWRIAIECDGHDFHERTKEQAERDRSRDRALTTAGWRVLRFTGREIWRDPMKVVDEVEALTAQLLRGV